jgi:predicted GNAT family acetyltransferase
VESGGVRQRTFLSFNCSQCAGPVPEDVRDGTALDPELTEAFARFGNDVSYLADAFRRGARWFAYRCGGEVRSACVVYQNFESVWEVAAVLTQPKWRRRGLARCVVAAGLQYLLRGKLQPRYQVDAENQASVALARSLGLSECLRVEHISMPERATAA